MPTSIALVRQPGYFKRSAGDSPSVQATEMLLICLTESNSPATDEHLRALTAWQRAMVFDAVDEHLAHQPAVETRNRKLMRL